MTHSFRSLALFSVLLAGCGGSPDPANYQRTSVEGPEAKEAQAGKPVERKIIYTVRCNLAVEDFGSARDGLETLVKQTKGAIIARADEYGSPGSPRNGTWVVRVPPDQLDAFLGALAKIGEINQKSIDSRDVTEEFYDVEADIRNKKVEEEAFLNLEKTAAKFEDLLAAKREVIRVRTEIDRLQKRFNVLDNLVSLTTVTITMSNQRDYIPETTNYSGTVARTWAQSWASLGRFFQNLSIALVAFVPWLLALLVVGWPLLALFRWWRRKPTA